MTQTSRIVLPVDVVALTTNAIKLEEMRAFYPTLLSRKTDLFEAQDPDPQVVVAGKLAQIMDHDPGSALIVEDTGLAFSAWGQLPGAGPGQMRTRRGDARLSTKRCASDSGSNEP